MSCAGYDLLKKKSDALMFRFRDITRKIKDAKEEMGELSRAAAFSLSEAVWAAGDFKCVQAAVGVAVRVCALVCMCGMLLQLLG